MLLNIVIARLIYYKMNELFLQQMADVANCN